MHPAPWLILICSLAAGADQPAQIGPDFAMDSDPLLVTPDPVVGFSDKYLPLWLQALSRPDADLQRLAAETIAQARGERMPKLEQAIPALLKIVSATETHPAARF